MNTWTGLLLVRKENNSLANIKLLPSCGTESKLLNLLESEGGPTRRSDTGPRFWNDFAACFRHPGQGIDHFLFLLPQL